jgi:DNA modification methylase
VIASSASTPSPSASCAGSPPATLSRKDFHPQYEPIWYGWREGAPRRCAPVDRAISDVWHIDRPRKSEQHPTMKPILLVARAIDASSNPGDLVLDPFAGSGTTILAAEQLGRKAAGIELDPRYADVIVERWQDLTGKKANRIPG